MIDTTNLDGRSFAMPGPMKITDPARTPVRGDLAHISLAGRYFVPHYAVPLSRQVAGDGAVLRASARSDADTLAELAAGTPFEVLDIAGLTAWGQVREADERGLVGYIALGDLEDAA